jgi:predicted site-specific integrase-resolvase
MLTNDTLPVLKVTPRTVRELADSGRLKCARTPSGIRVFVRSDVEALAAQRAKQRAAKARS